MAFGLAATTFIALFLVPSLYCIIDDCRTETAPGGAAPVEQQV